MRNQGKQQGRKGGRRIEINYVKTSAEGGDESEISESAREKGAEGHHRGREQGGRRVERSITSGPGVVTLKRVNGREPNFPPTHFFSLHRQHLSISSLENLPNVFLSSSLYCFLPPRSL